ncbi:hypothetical protein [Amycolatopsis sp. NPDC051128]|uniref:hypothetical protein n=1 Tax=Amycolatopsis sp. NPDC051128 TaxID=3155412 RepID=UPI00344A4FA4
MYGSSGMAEGPGAPDMIVLTAEPGTPSHDALRILASWDGEEVPGGGGTLTARQPLRWCGDQY